MNIGIIGSGLVGGTLGTRWAQGGHRVVFSSANSGSQKIKDLVARAGSNARAATVEEASKVSDVLLLATPWVAAESAIASAGDVTGKVLMDATNPLLSDLSGLSVGTDRSAGEIVQQLATGAKVVKAFNTIGYNIMANPQFGGEKAMMAYCGDDSGAKKIVKQLATELGFDALDAGPLTQARVLEPLALFWISLAYPAGYGSEIAFKFLKR
jgi:8-hydroxy-5-deazaflavin:NADPH oxidoreductase